MVFNYGTYGKFHSGANRTISPYICQRERTEFNFEYKKVLKKLETLIYKLSLLFKTTGHTNNLTRRGVNTQSLTELCSEIEKFPNKFGVLKDGPIFSIPILGVSYIIDDVFLSKLNSLDESSSFHISSCGLKESLIYTIKHEMEELKKLGSIKNYTDDTEEWVDDDTCRIADIVNSIGTR